MGSAKRRKKKKSFMPILAFIVLILMLAVPTVYITSDNINLDIFSTSSQDEAENSKTGMPEISETGELYADVTDNNNPEDKGYVEDTEPDIVDFPEADDLSADEADSNFPEDKGDDLDERLASAFQEDVYENDMDDPDHDIEINEPAEEAEPEIPVENTDSDNEGASPELLASLEQDQLSDAAGWHDPAEDRVNEKDAGEENNAASLSDTPENPEASSVNIPDGDGQMAELNIAQEKPLKDNETEAIENNSSEGSDASQDQLIAKNDISAYSEIPIESNDKNIPPVDEPAIKEELNTTDTIEEPLKLVSDSSAADEQENQDTEMTGADILLKEADREPVEQVLPEINLAFKGNALHDMADEERMAKELSSTLKEMYVTYEETFNDNSNNWHIVDTETVSAKIINGKYVIENNDHAGTHIILHQHDFPHHLDFIIETTVQTERNEGDYSFGYVFGARDTRNYFSLQVQGSRLYTINKSKDGKIEKISAGEIVDAPVNNNSPVTLKIERRDDSILFYVSDRFIGSLSNFRFSGKKIGFIVEGDVIMAVDKTRSQVRYQNK
jgi:hypothetical protein